MGILGCHFVNGLHNGVGHASDATNEATDTATHVTANNHL
jgi:hypothetical protein